MRFICKTTNDLLPQEIKDLLSVLNSAFCYWGEQTAFQWKYVETPYGESIHTIVYDGGQPVGHVAFWRTEIEGQPAYECVDGAVVQGQRNKGIFAQAAAAGIARLDGEYIYAYPSHITRPALLKAGLPLEREFSVTVHWAPIMLGRYRMIEPIPDEYVKWRYLGPLQNRYFAYLHGQEPYLLIKRRKHMYVVGGRLSSDFGLQRAQPAFVFSYDFPGSSFRFPRKPGFFLENVSRFNTGDFIPGYLTDRF